VLIDRFDFKDIAIKVVGVGSVGTYCTVMLLMASEQDPLFLQVKEARPSVLEAYAGKSIYPNHGQRVVNGYRLMQSASDIFLGWSKGKLGREVYFRQLRDMKVGALVDLFSRGFMVGTPRPARGRWPRPTLAPAGPHRSAGTSARATPSTKPSRRPSLPTTVRQSGGHNLL
jgi:hypothetical protein